MHFDVIVCGAGPAGCIAARILAATGRKVALLEKQLLPRHKTCGGGVPAAIARYLPEVPPSIFVETSIQLIRHTFRFSNPILAPAVSAAGGGTCLWMVNRSVFDYTLCQAARAAGTEIMDGTAATEVESSGDRVRVKACTAGGSSLSATADFVIGADGANGVCARTAGGPPAHGFSVGLEIEKPHSWGDGHQSLQPHTVHLDYGSIRNGYAWVFPKKDHLNIGAGWFGRGPGGPKRPSGESLRRTICSYMESLGIGFQLPALKFHAHPLPVWNEGARFMDSHGRLLLVGDAAQLVNPFIGDGIMNAVRSAELAADAIISGASREYPVRIREAFDANLRSAGRYAALFYRCPGLWYRLVVKREQATRVALRLVGQQLSYPEVLPLALKRLRAGRLFAGS